MNFKNLFKLKIVHSYFSEDLSGLLPEIDRYINLTPTQECLNSIRQYRLNFYKLPGQWCLASPFLTNDSTFLANSVITFRFHLEITDPRFFTFTDFAQFSLENWKKGIEIPQYSSQTGQVELKLDTYKHITSDTFTIAKERSETGSFFLQSQPIPRLGNADFQITGLEPKPTLTYDSNLQRIYFNTINEAYQTGQSFELTYRAIHKLRNNAFGIVNLSVDARNLQTDLTYRISFNRNEGVWQYYIISDKTTTDSDLKVIHSLNGDGSISFKDAEEQKDGEVYKRLKNSYPEAKIFKISSSEVLPFKAKTKLNLKLKKKEKTIIKNLPNPIPEKQGIEIVNIFSK